MMSFELDKCAAKIASFLEYNGFVFNQQVLEGNLSKFNIIGRQLSDAQLSKELVSRINDVNSILGLNDD